MPDFAQSYATTISTGACQNSAFNTRLQRRAE